jgi:eukaryotic-like serine/threonine-protein kinase
MSRTADGHGTNASGSAPDADAELATAVQEYMSEIDAGRRPNRQKFLARHAHIAGELAACIQGLSFVQSAAAQMHHADQNAASRNVDAIGADLATTHPLGDFKLVREIGRGGMGVVYEAVQLSLGRRVALKVLSMAGALDPRHLKRFRNEAQAAAQLHHTNIVPVYAVGCERSVHFYAMQLIEGQSPAHVSRGCTSWHRRRTRS